MAIIEISILKTEFYLMTAEQRIAALKKSAEEAIERDKQPYKPREPEGDTFPEWIRAIIKEIVSEVKGQAKYDRLNNTWKIAVPDLEEDNFFVAWKARVSKALGEDPEKQKWYNETPVQATSLVDVTQPTLDTDEDLQELSEVR